LALYKLFFKILKTCEENFNDLTSVVFVIYR